MKKILISFIQDRSGSMSTVWEETLSGFKTYVADMLADQQKDNEVEYLFSLTTFDTQIDTPYISKPIAEVNGGELRNYGPRGMTALYDAVGKTLQKHDDDKSITFDKAIVVIVTDGEENSSREYSKEALHAAIDERIKRGNWTFTYLGTQPETWNEAQSLGIGVGASAIYDAAHAGATYRSMASASATMSRGIQGQSMSFIHDNTTPMMRSAVGMRTATDDADDTMPVTTATTVKVPPTTAPFTRPRVAPHKPAPGSRRWK